MLRNQTVFDIIWMDGDKMKENVLIDKSIDFGARIVKLYRYLVKTKHETVLSKQILRSGTSIGANIPNT